MVYHSLCDVSKSQKLRMHPLCTLLLRLNAMKAKGGRWGFPLKPQKTPFCGRNESFPNQVLFALGMGRGGNATLTNLFNPISGRDASHPCLISTWPKEECTIMCVGLSKSVRVTPEPKVDNSFLG